ncbi:MAG: peptidylprolyl isomerase, partial [Planctomycetaceae bacterium]
FQGSLSMAHAGKDTGGSQFFLTHLPTPHLNPNPEEKRGHTVFGRVIKGLDNALALRVGDKIEVAKVLRKREHAYEPKTLPDPRGRRPAPPKPSDKTSPANSATPPRKPATKNDN